ncbi:MAG TPA: hypothetical protein VF945_06540 [Polyangia bacterium]
MKTSVWIVLLTVAVLGMVVLGVGGCGAVDIAPDLGADLGGGGGSGGNGGKGDLAVAPGADLAGVAAVTVVGTWLSSGSNLAPGFTKAPFNVTSITGVFNDDKTYSVTSTDSSGKTSTSAGTWSATPSSVAGIFDFTQNQTQPSAATAQGIYQIDAGAAPPLLTLEGVQTMPSLGATPPTAASGFGSTVVNGMKTSDWIQKYVRQ